MALQQVDNRAYPTVKATPAESTPQRILSLVENMKSELLKEKDNIEKTIENLTDSLANEREALFTIEHFLGMDSEQSDVKSTNQGSR